MPFFSLKSDYIIVSGKLFFYKKNAKLDSLKAWVARVAYVIAFEKLLYQ